MSTADGGGAPLPRWIAVAFAVALVVFVPYVVLLAYSLPQHAVAHHYDTAWTGLDVAEGLTLAATGWFIWTRSRWIAMAATAAATLVTFDAWFDVTTDRAAHRPLAIVEAVCVELPIAALCLLMAHHAELVASRPT